MDNSVQALLQVKYSLFYCPEKGEDGQRYVYEDWVYGEKEAEDLPASTYESLGALLAHSEKIPNGQHLCTWSVIDLLVLSIGRLEAGPHKELRKSFRSVFKLWKIRSSFSVRTFRWMNPCAAKAIMVGLCRHQQSLLSLVERIDERHDFQLMVSFVSNIIELIFKQTVKVQTDMEKSATIFRCGSTCLPYSPFHWFVDRKEANRFMKVGRKVAVVAYGLCELTIMDPNTHLGYLQFSVSMCFLLSTQCGIDREDVVLYSPTDSILAHIAENSYKMQVVEEEANFGIKKIELLMKKLKAVSSDRPSHQCV